MHGDSLGTRVQGEGGLATIDAQVGILMHFVTEISLKAIGL